MTVFRYIGLALISAALLLGGFARGRKCREECDILSGICRLISAIRSGIEGYGMPLCEIYASFNDKALADCGFLDELRRSDFTTSLEKTDFPFLGDGTRTLLKDFSLDLGRSPAEDQIRLCEATLSVLEAELNAKREALPGKLKVVRTVTLSMTFMAIIILA